MEMTTEILMSTMNTTSNGTVDDGNEVVTLLTQVSNILVLVFLMISMGCTIELDDLKETFRHPAGFFIGMLCQFVLMPLIAFCLSLTFKLESAGALSVLILACCPGGTLSNLFTFWTGGDVCLSVCMTTVSTAVAIGMMPLNLFIYSRVWTDDKAVIPYVNIVTTLVSILIPVAFGVFLRWWKKEWTKYITRFGVVLAFILIIMVWVLFFMLNPTWLNAGWQLWICAMLLPFLGYGFGYSLAILFRQSHFKCRAISFETGSQNVSLATTLIVVSFTDSPLFLDMLFYPGLYAVFLYVDSFVVIILMKGAAYLRKKRNLATDEGYDENKNDKIGLDNEGMATDQEDGVRVVAMKQITAEN
ncbi:sodium-dependent organic anion transporter-like [Lytechinus pictus]|uniref:sodium-dependent organic anion transporter-like n=1 Tax=Lytechinus pictus TaxID=7653 RepID=UPI0030B9E761